MKNGIKGSSEQILGVNYNWSRFFSCHCFIFPVPSSQLKSCSLSLSHFWSLSLLKCWLKTSTFNINKFVSHASKSCCPCHRPSCCKKIIAKDVRWFCGCRGDQNSGALNCRSEHVSNHSMQVLQLVCQECLLSITCLPPDANSIYLNWFR